MGENTVTGALVALVVGLGMLGGVGYMWVEESEAVNTYQQTDATVVSSEVAPGAEDYRPEITYEYTVDGRTYESSNVYPGPRNEDKSEFRAEEIVANYSEGKSVTAYYDPDEPSNAYLIENRNVLLPVGLAGFGMLTVFLSLTSLIRRLTRLAT